MSNDVTYVSLDIETDGPIPGVYSMLSFGAAAFRSNGSLQSTFSRNLELLPGAMQHEDTMKWWASQPEAWAACREDIVPPYKAMYDFKNWVNTFPNPTAVAYPAGFDFTFIYWYLMKFCGESPFSFSCLDIKTLAMVATGTEYRKVSKRSLPKTLKSHKTHTHKALDDAIEQGEMFFKIRDKIHVMTTYGDM